MSDPEIVMYTVKDLQQLFQCGRDKAYKIMKIKGFPSIRVGEQYVVEKAALKKWITVQQGKHVLL